VVAEKTPPPSLLYEARSAVAIHTVCWIFAFALINHDERIARPLRLPRRLF
jgi:hypothetical protein